MVFLAIAVTLLSLAVAAAICSSLLAHPPAGLVRTNFRGSEVAVVGGIVILAGLLAGEVGLSIAYLLHPGRGAAPTFTSRGHWGLPVAAATLLWLAPDLGERGMLGDVGANLLGAVLGAGAVLSLGVPGRLAVLGVLVALTAAAERWSFSRAIDATPPLRWLDRLGRVR